MSYISPLAQMQQNQQRGGLGGAMNGYQPNYAQQGGQMGFGQGGQGYGLGPPQGQGGWGAGFGQGGNQFHGSSPGGGGGQGGGQGGGSNNPMQPVYMPSPPQGVAATSNINLSPNATIAKIMQGFLPQERQATNAMNNQLAAGGIVGGGAQGAQQLLQGQLSSSIAPTLANAIQGSQGMELQQALGNAGMTNSMNSQNLQDWMGTNQFNANAANDSRMALAQMLQNAWGTQAGGLSSILGQGLGGASGLAGSEANNFPVYQNQGLLGMLGL
jgi:hypothetical protein